MMQQLLSGAKKALLKLPTTKRAKIAPIIFLLEKAFTITTTGALYIWRWIRRPKKRLLRELGQTGLAEIMPKSRTLFIDINMESKPN